MKLESAAGGLLVAAALLALVVSNSPLAPHYVDALAVPLAVSIGEFAVDKPLLLWINDGLMAVFFLLIGLEIKREMLEGELSSVRQIVLPAAAGVGGFLVPAFIYAAINWGDGEALEGWAIPAATDIAFALGVLAVLGSRVPLSLKVFLTTIAIFDDIAAILVIAIFYTDDLSLMAFALATLGGAALFALNRAGVSSLAPYVLVGLFVWVCVLKSGVHATLAGMALALAIPMTCAKSGESPLRRMEHGLHPWVAFAILPVFAFANAGVSFAGIDPDVLFGPVSLGIVAGLFIGKQLGVFTTAWALVKLGWARLPDGMTWLSLYGVSLLTGIGFTMSLFVGSLAFERGNFDNLVATRVGVLAGSILSAVVGYAVLRFAIGRREAPGRTRRAVEVGERRSCAT